MTVTVERQGPVTILRHLDDGIIHNPHGPAIMVNAPHGPTSLLWVIHGDYHRVGDPADISVNESPKGTYFAWVQRRTQHRLDGPALSWGDGTIHWVIEDAPSCAVDARSISHS